MSFGNEECWAVETSRDGSQWRWLGKAWSEPLETEGRLPMTMVRMEDEQREDLWPGDEHLGLPMLLPGGETGRLLGFEYAPDGSSWRYTLEFRGAREG